jgi:hypothetical protein
MSRPPDRGIEPVSVMCNTLAYIEACSPDGAKPPERARETAAQRNPEKASPMAWAGPPPDCAAWALRGEALVVYAPLHPGYGLSAGPG